MMDCQNDECQARSAAAVMQSAAQAMRKTLADIYELADPRATTPTQNMQEIRIKASVALRAAAQLGLMP